MIVFIIIIFILIVCLVYSVLEYGNEMSRTRKIIDSIPFLALIITIFTNNKDHNANSQ